MTESLVSVMILTLLALAVAATIQVALRITDDHLDRSGSYQDEINAVITGISGNSGLVTFSAEGRISASHYITIYEKDGIIAFEPRD